MSTDEQTTYRYAGECFESAADAYEDSILRAVWTIAGSLATMALCALAYFVVWLARVVPSFR